MHHPNGGKGKRLPLGTVEKNIQESLDRRYMGKHFTFSIEKGGR